MGITTLGQFVDEIQKENVQDEEFIFDYIRREYSERKAIDVLNECIEGFGKSVTKKKPILGIHGGSGVGKSRFLCQLTELFKNNLKKFFGNQRTLFFDVYRAQLNGDQISDTVDINDLSCFRNYHYCVIICLILYTKEKKLLNANKLFEKITGGSYNINSDVFGDFLRERLNIKKEERIFILYKIDEAQKLTDIKEVDNLVLQTRKSVSKISQFFKAVHEVRAQLEKNNILLFIAEGGTFAVRNVLPIDASDYRIEQVFLHKFKDCLQMYAKKKEFVEHLKNEKFKYLVSLTGNIARINQLLYEVVVENKDISNSYDKIFDLLVDKCESYYLKWINGVSFGTYYEDALVIMFYSLQMTSIDNIQSEEHKKIVFYSMYNGYLFVIDQEEKVVNFPLIFAYAVLKRKGVLNDFVLYIRKLFQGSFNFIDFEQFPLHFYCLKSFLFSKLEIKPTGIIFSRSNY